MTYVPGSLRITFEEAEHTPEQRLWLAVLACAARDIKNGGDLGEAAKRWMCTRDKDTGFRNVCDNAGIDPDAFRSAVVEFIESNHGGWRDPASLDDALLSGRIFSVTALGHPAHIVVERMQELMDDGCVFERMGKYGTYRYNVTRTERNADQRRKIQQRKERKTEGAKVARERAEQSKQQRRSTQRDTDQLILSGNAFDAGPARSYIRTRITTLRQKGYVIPSLGHRKFRCENPDKSFTSA